MSLSGRQASRNKYFINYVFFKLTSGLQITGNGIDP